MAEELQNTQQTPVQITLRGPSSHTLKGAKQPPNPVQLTAPSSSWLSGTWNVTYSSLPLWRGKQNVRITYSSIGVEPGSTPDKMPDLDDLVEYQKLKVVSEKFSSVHGVSKPVEVEGVAHGLAYHWRGKGMLMIATSNWEILAYGTDIAGPKGPNDYVVTYFGKTLFTPPGIDIYTRTSASLSESTLAGIKAALAAQPETTFTAIAESIFEIPRTSQ